MVITVVVCQVRRRNQQQQRESQTRNEKRRRRGKLIEKTGIRTVNDLESGEQCGETGVGSEDEYVDEDEKADERKVSSRVNHIYL